MMMVRSVFQRIFDSWAKILAVMEDTTVTAEEVLNFKIDSNVCYICVANGYVAFVPSQCFNYRKS